MKVLSGPCDATILPWLFCLLPLLAACCFLLAELPKKLKLQAELGAAVSIRIPDPTAQAGYIKHKAALAGLYSWGIMGGTRTEIGESILCMFVKC